MNWIIDSLNLKPTGRPSPWASRGYFLMNFSHQEECPSVQFEQKDWAGPKVLQDSLPPLPDISPLPPPHLLSTPLLQQSKQIFGFPVCSDWVFRLFHKALSFFSYSFGLYERVLQIVKPTNCHIELRFLLFFCCFFYSPAPPPSVLDASTGCFPFLVFSCECLPFPRQLSGWLQTPTRNSFPARAPWSFSCVFWPHRATYDCLQFWFQNKYAHHISGWVDQGPKEWWGSLLRCLSTLWVGVSLA